MVYSVEFEDTHTIGHLTQFLAARLKLSPNKLCLFSRQIAYHDSLFHLPLTSRSTTSTFTPFESDYPLNMVLVIYLHVEWQQSTQLVTEEVERIVSSLSQMVQSSQPMVSGGARHHEQELAIREVAIEKAM
eukprot:2469944-Amphidinium_carterae.1